MVWMLQKNLDNLTVGRYYSGSVIADAPLKIASRRSMMRKKLFFPFLVVACIFTFVPCIFADSDLGGWWKASINFNEGDFVTGGWEQFQTLSAKSISYLYIFLQSASSGTAYLIVFDKPAGTYFLENIYSVYIKNNILTLTGPATADTDGNLTSSSTIVLRASGTLNHIKSMKGYYTRYDEDSGFVGMGSLTASRITFLQTIPDAVKQLIPNP